MEGTRSRRRRSESENQVKREVVWNEEKEKMEVVPLAEAKAKQRFLDYVNSGGVDDGTDEEVEEEESSGRW